MNDDKSTGRKENTESVRELEKHSGEIVVLRINEELIYPKERGRCGRNLMLLHEISQIRELRIPTDVEYVLMY